jgi:S1-C subfamily serine protease
LPTDTQVSYAVPVNAIADFVKEAISGRRDRPTPPVVERRSVDVETGIRLLDAHLSRSPPAYIERVADGSPAAKAGLKPDDLVFRVDGRVVRSCRAFEDALRGRTPGERLKLLVKRQEQVLPFELELAPRRAGGGQ